MTLLSLESPMACEPRTFESCDTAGVQDVLRELQAACVRLDALVTRILGSGTEACRRKASRLLRDQWTNLERALEHRDAPRQAAGPDAASMPILSPREREVLRWIANGKSNAVIAEILGISPHTVDTHNRRIFRKLGTCDRTTAAIKALDEGLLPPG